MQTIYLEPNQVPDHIRTAIGYSGRQWQVVVAESYDVPCQQWSGGSRTTAAAIDLTNGKTQGLRDPRPWPHNMSHPNARFPLASNLAIFERIIFCGKDLGVRLVIHPDNAPQYLPAAKPDLSEIEQVVLEASCAYKASYGGRDRYQMVTDCYGSKWTHITRDQWESAKARLIERKLLNKRGAVTTAGRNAREQNKIRV